MEAVRHIGTAVAAGRSAPRRCAAARGLQTACCRRMSAAALARRGRAAKRGPTCGSAPAPLGNLAKEHQVRVGVRIADIPDSLLVDINYSLQHYFVPILGLANERRTEPLRLIGSGTLVKIDSNYHILTAAHVWDATEPFLTIGLLIASHASCSSIPREYIVARELRGSGSEDSGPDLALLAIPAPFVPQILAHKSVLDLSQERNKFFADPSRPDFGLWGVTGMVEGLSSVRQRLEQGTIQVEVHECSFFGGIDGTHDRDGYDYLDVGVDMGLAAVPPSFGGVSGGALWRIVLSKNKTGQILWGGKKDFHGVAFWQSATREGRRVIRCHGRKSLFEKAWKEWGLPN